MNEEKRKFRKGLSIALALTIVIWLIKIIEISFDLNFVSYGVLPRTVTGLKGIFLYPFIHGNFEHLISNSFPIMFLVTALFYFYPSSSTRVLVLIYLLSGVLLWLIGRESYHIGASGVVYGLITYTFFSGIIKWDRRSIVLSLIVTFLYGGFTWGILPLDEKVSWEGHLSGAIVGIICAVIFKNNDPYDKFAGMEDDEPAEELSF